jgi:aminomethyltransferase
MPAPITAMLARAGAAFRTVLFLLKPFKFISRLCTTIPGRDPSLDSGPERLTAAGIVHDNAVRPAPANVRWTPLGKSAVGTELRVWLPDNYASERGRTDPAWVFEVPFRASVNPSARQRAHTRGEDAAE